LGFVVRDAGEFEISIPKTLAPEANARVLAARPMPEELPVMMTTYSL
jgi:hypothetical protein